MEAVARNLLESAKRMAPERFELRAVTPLMHPHAPWRDYDAMRQVMENLGFRILGDFEPVGQSDDPQMTRANVLRIFVSHDGIITAAFYKLALRWTLGGLLARLGGGGRGILDLMTAFTDGITLETSTAPLVGKWQSPPFLLREYQPQMHPAALLARHTERIAEQTQWNPAAQPYRVSTIEQVVAMGHETARRKREFRRSLGWITRDELETHAGQMPPAQVDRIYAEIRRLVALEAAAEPSPPPPSTWTPPPPRQSSIPAMNRVDPPPQASSHVTPPTPAGPGASGEPPAAQPVSPGAEVDRQPAIEAAASPPSGSPAASEIGVAASGLHVSGETATIDDSSPAGVPAPSERASQPTERTLEELVGRAVVMNALINLHFRAPVEIVRRWIEANGAAEHLSPRERALVAKPNAEVKPEERVALRGYIEALWALLWVGGVADGLAPGQPVPGHMATLVPNLKTNEDASKLRDRMRLRSTDEIAEMRSRYERVHASIRDGASLPTVDAGVVKNRRRALEWLANPALGWDDVDA